jgi:hypothetical protein
MNVAVKPENVNTAGALAGKLSLVTGSTSGIGLGIARALPPQVRTSCSTGLASRTQRCRQDHRRCPTAPSVRFGSLG